MQQQTLINLPSTPSSAATSFYTAFSPSIFVGLPATSEENWSLCRHLDQLFRLRVVMNINEKKYGLLLVESNATLYDMIRRAVSKSTDDVVLIKTVSISA
jgi:hypothetical protein